MSVNQKKGLKGIRRRHGRGRTARISISTILFVEESPTAVEIPAAHEEVSSVVVLLSFVSIVHSPKRWSVCDGIQLCEDAIEGRASTTGCSERYPGELANGGSGFRWRGVFGMGRVDRFGYERFCFRFHGY